MQIDITKNYRQYDAAELRSYAYRNLLVCGSYDMSDFLEYIFQGMISEDEAGRIVEEANEQGYDVGYQEGFYEGELCGRGDD